MILNNMRINDIRIGGFYCSADNVYHVKSLPCLSIVQAVQGHYNIKIQDSPEFKLDETDEFVVNITGR